MPDHDVNSPGTYAQGTDPNFPPAAGQALVGTVVADRYRVERLLGEGAMGAVYRAEHVHMQKAVALKVLHHAMSQNPEVVRRFEREAIAAARIEHPHVAGASDFGQLSDGSFYLVLEFIDGKSLGQLMEEVGLMPPERACRIAAQIAAALSAAHNAGIVHRDLKPENVMMPQSDAVTGDFVKVLDFGMAKLQQTDSTETKLTMHGAVYGTPQYMAPEQAAGQDVDHRADLYALGLMMYEMLSGKTPFDAENMMTLLVKHMTETPPPLPASVPKELSRLVMKCLEKKPGDRPQSAEQIVQELAELMGETYQDPRRSVVTGSAPMPLGSPRAQASSVMAMKVAGTVAPWVERVLPWYERSRPFLEKTKVYLSRARDWLQGSWLVAGRSIPRWMPTAAVFGFAVVLLALTTESEPSAANGAASLGVPSSLPGSAPAIEPRPDPHPPDAELAKVIQSAAMGSESALYALEQRTDDERSITEWVGLTKARLMNKKVKEGISAFSSAIKLDAAVAHDPVILGALRRLADQDEYAEPIIEFVADELGSTGADLLFHIWAKTSLKTNATTLAFSKLTSGAVKKQFSPALRVAMHLRDAESCEDYREQLPDIARYGDDRTLTKLRPLLKQRGCGPSEQDDCYPCLHKDKALEDAMQAAGMRKSPQFELRDFRFKK